VSPAVGLPGSVSLDVKTSESRRRASGRREPLSRFVSQLWFAEPSCPVRSWSNESPASSRGAWVVGLVPIRGLPHRVTRDRNGFAGGGAFSVVEPFTSLRGGDGEKCSLLVPSSAGSAPRRPPSARLLYCRTVHLAQRGGWGEVFAVAGVSVTRASRGPEGYIQVGMRGRDHIMMGRSTHP
jgi:hypothetical protein